ncbi:5-methyltetrahydropteroyltriglutamate--homocysteine methyltransferase [Nocardia sp. CS682]|uniref:5-methyltetrahydropteroyltriglutamate-- homocysteine methyltransferase n=1 Tax=Nocardia sp. CS682 TaxID=1047172 RepID=UPI001074EF33|nr:5-methyltetrahydropteroyltriglutamate--homocysteine methyltransferase [Nocardia sp. CS682]QBS44899.1 5-methyltetrahydropteroyltriglutamate--homocysteine methyltransferase [Nocardia sp. CS682]
MPLPTEPIGSIPRPASLLKGTQEHAAGQMTDEAIAELYEAAVRDTIAQLESLGSPVVTDGEQAKPSFVTYPLAGLPNLSADGALIPFADGHTRQLPRLNARPFRYATFSAHYLQTARKYATTPVKQAVIAASAVSLVYPADSIEGYPREEFFADLVANAEADIRGALDGGADSVQLDFTEGRLSLKLDPSGALLDSFVALNNRVLDRFTSAERQRIGVHTCPGGDQDSTHSLDVDYVQLLPKLFDLHAGRFYVQLASEPDPDRVLGVIAEHLPPEASIFVGVIDPIHPTVETTEQVRDRVLNAARHLPVERLGTCDDCGFSPFGDDVSTSRDTAFAKIRVRLEGTAAASAVLGV